MPGLPRAIVMCFVLAAAFGQHGAAATITVNAPDADGRTFVDIIGDIVINDDKAFQQKVANLHNVVVTLASTGGDAFVAIAIGEEIRRNAWTTYVPSGAPCASACGLIWLGRHAAHN